MTFLFIGSLIAAFFVGSIPTGHLAGKLKGIDIRERGSGNTGATNTFRVLGPFFGIGVLVVDIGKGLLATTLIYGVFSPHPFIQIALGIAVICGHVFSVFLEFRGGKGVATWIGALLGISFGLFILAIALFLIAFILTRQVSLGSLVGAFGTCMIAFPSEGIPPLFIFSFVAFIVIAVTHRDNIMRLVEGKEPRIL